MTTIRILIALAASMNWDLFQLDINNAFLHGDVKVEVCMVAPEGVNNPHNLVCKLKKSLYGLKQASRQWFAKLVHALESQGFVQSKNDYSLFINTVLDVYVDDIILTGNDLSSIQILKQFLDATFSIKDLGFLHYFLGIEVNKIRYGIFLTQHKFTKDLLEASGIVNWKPVATPLPLHLRLSTHVQILCFIEYGWQAQFSNLYQTTFLMLCKFLVYASA